jgi:hypothetical protein
MRASLNPDSLGQPVSRVGGDWFLNVLRWSRYVPSLLLLAVDPCVKPGEESVWAAAVRKLHKTSAQRPDLVINGLASNHGSTINY